MDLAAFRTSRALSQAQVAEQLGLASKSYISGLESGAVRCPLRLALQIEAWSDGAVPASSLLEPEDAHLLQAAIERAARQLAEASA